tara:strand:+ start:66054 stop:66653 length:600 start_codon:yes stop_codon:yes gene_type:complete
MPEQLRTVASLIEQLQSSDRMKRLSAASQIAALEGKAKEAIPILKSWIGGEDKYSHVTALGTIIWIDKSEADTLIPLLIEALQFDGLEQWEAILWIQSLGKLALPAVPALERLVDEGDMTICWITSDAIFQITDNPSSVLRVGQCLLESLDEQERYVGVEHLMQLGKSVIPDLENVSVHDRSDLVRNRALAALEEIERC